MTPATSMPKARRIALGAALLASGAFASDAIAQPAASAAPEPVAVQLVDALEGVFGRHDGQRRSGAKGVCATGEFVANGAGAALTTASTLQPNVRSPVVARFSIGGGNPAAPDNAPSVRGLSLSLEGPGGDAHEFVLINTPVFSARTPESFVTYLRVRAPDPATRAMNPQAIAAANAANADWTPQIAYLRDNPPPASYATSAYFGVNSFVLTNRQGARQVARWTFEPVAGRIGLTPEERQARGANFLADELRGRVTQRPAEWRVLLQLPQPGDAVDDAVTAWPADRRTVEVGTLRISGVQPAGASGACDAQIFNPTLLPDGIEASADPILAIRAEAYAVSGSRRAR
jgi:catalase